MGLVQNKTYVKVRMKRGFGQKKTWFRSKENVGLVRIKRGIRSE